MVGFNNHNPTSAASSSSSPDLRDHINRVSDSESTPASIPTVDSFGQRRRGSDIGGEETTRLLIHEMSFTRADSGDKPSGAEELELGRDGAADAGASPVEYKLYKRRFIGLGCLCLLNIAVSWGWLTFAPVASLTVEWFDLESESPVNWISTVILLAYPVATP